MLCHDCHKLVQVDAVSKNEKVACPLCGASVHPRKPNSLTRTWALVITGLILFIPANVYPIMTIQHFGQGSPHTIMSGVIELFEAKMYAIGFLVFFASIAVPLMKLVGLIFLLLSVQLKWRIKLREQTIAYRIIEGIGRWSMLDMFVIALLVALVKLGSVATITAGIGATAFAGVVVVTMFAAMSFDPRLIWDNHQNRKKLL